MRRLSQLLLFALMVIAFMGSSCRHEPATNVNKDDSVASTGGGENDAAMIVQVKNDVTQKFRGATDFVHIPGGYFHAGDLLRVGDASTALIDCNESAVCSLGKGEYSRCCA